jgi:ABC-type antimicrobial peptide transport system permease subunit
MREITSISALPQRLAASVAGSLGTIALLLAAIGIYGVMAYAVACRTREIGVRMALGADAGAVMRLIAWQAFRLTAIGAGAGLVIALIVTRLLSGLLFGISPVDPIAFGLTVAALTGVTIAASYAPARRAARVDPLIALRAD